MKGEANINLLFWRSQNKRRSLTVEKIFDGYHGHKAYSVGTEPNARVKWNKLISSYGSYTKATRQQKLI